MIGQRIPDRDVTPHEAYVNRRTFMRAGLLTAAALGTGLLYRTLNRVELDASEMPAISGLVTAPHQNGFWVDEPMTPRASILNYNNFYEFSTDKDGVAAAAADFTTTGWQVSVGGLVGKPRVFDRSGDARRQDVQIRGGRRRSSALHLHRRARPEHRLSPGR